MTERHQPLLIVVAGFFVLLFGLWLFDLRGLGAVRADAREDLKKRQKDRQELTNPDNQWQVSSLLIRLQAENEELARTWERLRGDLLTDFPPLFPTADDRARPAQWVRQRHEELVEEVGRELETSRGIRISEEARELGFDFPIETVEPLADDEKWLRQMFAVERFVELLGSVGQTPRGEPHVRRLESITALEPRTVGSGRGYLREWPVQAKILVTREGLDTLLLQASRPAHLHRVASLSLTATPGARRAEEVTVREDERRRRWWLHYYSVTLEVATLVAAGDADAPAEGEAADEEASPGRREAPARRITY
jgi:hypothetical protein